MPPSTDRREVAAALSRRDRVDVVVVDAPAGFGRSAAIRAAVGADTADRDPGGDGTAPPATDVVVVLPPGPLAAEEVAGTVTAALGLGAGPGARTDDDAVLDGPAATVRAAVAAAAPVIVVVDHLHRAGPAAVELLGEVARDLPAGAHLVLGGAGLGGLGLGELVSDGRAVWIGSAELAVADAPPGGDEETDELLARWPAAVEAVDTRRWDVVDAVLAEALTLDVEEPARSLLGVLVALDVSDRPVAAAVAEALGVTAPDEVVDELARLPLVHVDELMVAIHPMWGRVLGEEPDVPAPAAEVVGERALSDGDIVLAGNCALAAGSADLLAAVVRSALRTMPPRVGADQLRTWLESGILAADDPHRWWLAAANAIAHGGPADWIGDELRRAGEAFAGIGDVDAEVACGLAAATVARQRDDLATIVSLMARADELAAAGHAGTRGAALLGRALLLQMGGDPAAALELLSRVDPDELGGDWGAQVAMVRGTNLMLLGRLDEARAALGHATGLGGRWTTAVALGLSSSARWLLGDRIGAVEDLLAGEAQAARVPAPSTSVMLRASRAVLLAAGSHPDAAALVAALAHLDGDDEAARLAAVATVLSAIDRGEVERSRSLAAELEAPDRATRSSSWVVALQRALLPDGEERWADVVAGHPPLAPALAAGAAAATYLDGGPAPSEEHHPYLPALWCPTRRPVVELRLLGRAEVRIDGRVVDHRNWDRARVRELCLHLALVRTAPRDLVAQHVWPDLTSDAAARNLRVTLSYLLDVVEPDRPKGKGSRSVEDRGSMTFAELTELHIDVREQLRSAQAVLDALALGNEADVVSGARQLLRVDAGSLLGGAAVGEWVEAHDEERRSAVLRAVASAGPVALGSGHADVAEGLGRLGLVEDPWAERLHQLVVMACMAQDDLDGARRALRHAVTALDELGVRPERRTTDLARRLGMALR